MFRVWSCSQVVFETDCVKIDLRVEWRGGDSPVKQLEYAATAPNDAPALRQAQIGLDASAATDITKSVAGIVLTAPDLEGFVLFPASTCPRRRHQQMCARTGFLQRLRSSPQRRLSA